MNKSLQLCLCAILLAASNLCFAQLNLKIGALPDNSGRFGVYAMACSSIIPTSNTITGSGQVTFKFPSAATFASLVNHAGTWTPNATIVNPSEGYGLTYISVGFLVDNPQIIYVAGSETLLFSFQLNGGNNPVPQLIVNGVDPFDQLPNSANSNPGNELTVLDFGAQPLGIYTYFSNYTGSTVACGNVEPQDTTIIDPPIDTTGNTDTTVIDTTGNTDTTIIDTTGNTDTTIIDTTGNTDTTIINPPNDTTGQTSGVSGLEKERKYFSLYPTPAYEWVTVKFLDSHNEGGIIRLFTMSGIPIGQLERSGNGELKLNVSGLSSGLYFLTYERDGKVLQRDKILKQ